MGGPAPARHPAESRTQTALLSPGLRRVSLPPTVPQAHPRLVQLPSPPVFLTARLPGPWIPTVAARLLSRLVASLPAPPPRPSVPSPRVSLHRLAPLSRGLPHGLLPCPQASRMEPRLPPGSPGWWHSPRGEPAFPDPASRRSRAAAVAAAPGCGSAAGRVERSLPPWRAPRVI